MKPTRLIPMLLPLILFYCLTAETFAEDIICPVHERCLDDAMEAYKAGKFEDALQIYRYISEEFDNFRIAGISSFMAGHIMAGNRAEEAEVYLEKAYSTYPLIGDYALFRLAGILSEKGDYERAIDRYKTISMLYPDSTLRKKSLLKTADSYLSSGNLPEARNTYKNYISAYPKDETVPSAIYGIGMSHLLENNISLAFDYFKRILVDYPASPASWSAKKSMNWLREGGYELPPFTSTDYYIMGERLYEAGLYADAIADYRRFLAGNKSISGEKEREAYFKIGMSDYNLRRSEEAEDDFDTFLKHYPRSLQVPEALYWLSRVYLREGKEDVFISTCKRYLKLYNDKERSSEILYRLGVVYADKRDINTATSYYDRVITEYPDSSFASDSLWAKGWFLYKMGEHKGALVVFNNILQQKKEPAYIPQALYWKIKILEKMKDHQETEKSLCQLCNEHRGSFYCLFAVYNYNLTCVSAVNVIGMDTEGDTTNEFGNYKVVATDDEKDIRIKLLLLLGMKEEAKEEVQLVRQRIVHDKERTISFASLLFSMEEYNMSLGIISSNFSKDILYSNNRFANRVGRLIYPPGYSTEVNRYASENNIEPYLLYALIREESWFNKNSVSPAGAIGLMQLMPHTASNVKGSYIDRDSLFDPETNISLGARFFSDLLKQYDGNIFMALAGYNAGPAAVSRWIKERDGYGLDEFIEDIPYKETRNYVKKVFTSYMGYLRIAKPVLKISTPPEGGN